MPTPNRPPLPGIANADMRGGGDDGGGERKHFAGMRFKLVGFKPDDKFKYSVALENGGGRQSIITLGPGTDCTHLIVCTYTISEEHEICEQGRQLSCTIVNDIWLEKCLREGALLPNNKIMYKPTIPGGIPTSLSLHICCTGYNNEKFEEIKKMVHLIGGSLYERWNRRLTHVICFKFEGEIYNKANEKGIEIVNEKWLRDCLNDWQILLCDDYKFSGEQLQTMEEDSKITHMAIVPDPIDPTRCRTPACKSKLTSATSNRLSKSTGDKKLRVESVDDCKPKCKRSLNFYSDRRALDEYLNPDDRVVSVKYPFHPTPRRLTSPTMKRIILKSYLLVARLHSDNLSLAGNFICKNFMISDPHEIVELSNVSSVSLTPVAREADRKTFIAMVRRLFADGVPMDVRVWLYNIKDGWEDALLLNHIYMGRSETTFGQFTTLYYCLIKLEKLKSRKHQEFLKSLAEYNGWYDIGFRWGILEQNKNYRDPREDKSLREEDLQAKKKKEELERTNVMGAVKVIRNTFMHPAKVLQEYFLAIILGEHPDLLADVQKALYDSGFYGKGLTIKQFA